MSYKTIVENLEVNEEVISFNLDLIDERGKQSSFPLAIIDSQVLQ